MQQPTNPKRRQALRATGKIPSREQLEEMLNITFPQNSPFILVKEDDIWWVDWKDSCLIPINMKSWRRVLAYVGQMVEAFNTIPEAHALLHAKSSAPCQVCYQWLSGWQREITVNA